MVTPEQAGLKSSSSIEEDIEHHKNRLEQFIDKCLSRMVLTEGFIHISLNAHLREYKSNEPNDGLKYNFYSKVLEPVCDKYKQNGWFVYCIKFYSFIQRDDLYFSSRPRPDLLEGYGFNNDHVIYKWNDPFYMPTFKTEEQAKECIKNYFTKKK